MDTIPEHMNDVLSETIKIQNQMAHDKNLWVIKLGLTPFVDGTKWCFLWGADLQSGVAGFGDTVVEAMHNFDKALYEDICK